MINGITSLLTNQSMVNLAQNTATRVSIETSLKAIGRPGFILADKDLDKDTKKYAATKELLYQAICLGVYLAIIPTIFKQGAFTIAKKWGFKNTKGFEKFKNAKDFLDFHRLASMEKPERLEAMKNQKNIRRIADNKVLMNELITLDNPANQYYLQKGTIEGGSFIGSILGLALLAPEISHHLIHPLMNIFGFEKKAEK